MPKKKTKSFSQKLYVNIRLFFRAYPTLPYVGKWLLLSSIISACIGSASAGFLISLDWAGNYRESHLWVIVLLPLVGFLIGLLYFRYGKEVEAGNNLLLDTIHYPKERIPFRMAPFVYVGTIATHLFGGSAGREGTALQMAGAIADQFSRPLRLRKDERKILLIASMAAGFGSVFGTPLAGAIFALEVFLIGRLRYDAIFPAFASAILSDWVARLWNAPHTHYRVYEVPEISGLNILYAVLAGIVFGLCAAIFSKSIHWLSNLLKAKITYPPLRPVVGGVIVAVAVWAIDTTKYIGLGLPTIVAAFEEPLPAYDFALKMLFTIVTLAAGFKGGEVTPLFYIGATLGNALAYLIPLPSSLLAGMGFVGVFAGATNTPLACMVMAIELFGSTCGAYVAIVCVLAYLMSGHNSIYKKQMIGEAKHKRFVHYEGKNIQDIRK